MKHQAFPGPNNSLSTLDSFSTSKEGSILKCNTLLAKTSAGQEFQRCKFKCRLLIPPGGWRACSWGKLWKPGALRKGGMMSYKENLASSRAVSNRRVRNPCNKQLESTSPERSLFLTWLLWLQLSQPTGAPPNVRRHSLNSSAQKISRRLLSAFHRRSGAERAEHHWTMKEVSGVSPCCSPVYNEVLFGQASVSLSLGRTLCWVLKMQEWIHHQQWKAIWCF